MKKLLFILPFVFLQCSPSAAQNTEISLERKERIEKFALPIFDRQDVLKLSQDRTFLPKKSAILLNENFLHQQGIFGLKQSSLSLLKDDPNRPALYSTFFVKFLYADKYSFDKGQLVGLAKKFTSEVFPWFDLSKSYIKIEDVPNNLGVCQIYFSSLNPDDVPTANVTIYVRTIDKKIVGFSGVKHTPWSYKITPAQAKSKAIKSYEKDALIKDVTVFDWAKSGGAGRYYYEIGLQATRVQDNVEVTNTSYIDSITGEIFGVGEGWRATDSSQEIDPFVGGPLIFKDSLPVWTKNGLLFSSTRPVAGMPDWARLPAQGLLRDAKGQIFHLSQDFEDSPRDLTGLPNGNWVGFDRGTWVYALDLDTGAYKMLSLLRREGNSPAVTADGANSVVIWDQGNGSYRTQDPFTDNLAIRNPWPDARSRLATLGEQGTPVFSPDGQWLYFATSQSDEKTGQNTHTLDRLPREVVNRGQAVAVTRNGETPVNPLKWSGATVQILATLPDKISRWRAVERLSFFPSGKQLLAQMPDGMVRIEISGDKGKVTPITLPTLTDAEIKAPLTHLKDGWAGPGEDEATFSAETKDAAGKVRRRIYSCRFDGSNLKAWTPKDAAPVTPYKFPKGTGDATTLAREWALLEVKYEKEDRERFKN